MGKKDKHRSGDGAAISTLLGRDTNIEGTLTFRETIRVDGRIKGRVLSPEGTMIIGEEADIEADITVATAIVRGKVTGCVNAKNRIELYPPAQVNGDVSAPVIAIETGVVFNGNCRMPGQANETEKPALKMAKVPDETF
jgi:cytoskeletal protein CcmA (bactofilin family)